MIVKVQLQIQMQGQEASIVKFCNGLDASLSEGKFRDFVLSRYQLHHTAKNHCIFKDLSHKLSSEEFEILNHIVEVQRKLDPAYAY